MQALDLSECSSTSYPPTWLTEPAQGSKGILPPRRQDPHAAGSTRAHITGQRDPPRPLLPGGRAASAPLLLQRPGHLPYHSAGSEAGRGRATAPEPGACLGSRGYLSILPPHAMSKQTSEVCSKPASLLNFKGMSSSRACVHARRPRLPRHSGEPRFSSVPLPAGHRASPGGGALASLCQAGRRTPWCSRSRREEVCMGGVGRPTSHFPRPG